MTRIKPKICPHCGIPQQWVIWRHCHCGYDFGPAEPPPPSSQLGEASPPPLAAEAAVFASRYGTMYHRFLACIVDAFIFLPLGWMDSYLEKSGSPVAAILFFVFKSAAFPIYSVAMNARYGQTLGKMSLGLKVLDLGEERIPTLKQAFLRDIGIITFTVAWLICALSFRLATNETAKVWTIAAQVLLSTFLLWTVLEILCVLLNDKRRALHDYIAGTVVIRTTKPR